MPNPNEIVAQMRQSLSLSEPDLDTSVGTPIRKVLDVVSEAIAEAYLDRYLLSYQYDIDAKSGADLDAFVGLFGFTRQAARRASGTIILQRDTPAVTSFVIPVGTQFSTRGTPGTICQTVSSATFPAGATSISVIGYVTIAGSAGNIAANSIVRWLSAVSGIVAVTNPAAFTGGMDGESDSQLRERFKRSLFRNSTGTEDMYLGVALDDTAVSRANVIGPSERWNEQIEIVSGTATSMISSNTATHTVTGATNASPAVVTTNKWHNVFPGDIVKIASVAGNTAVNGTWRVATTPSTTTLTLTSLDGNTAVNGNGSYTSGGTFTVIERCKWVYDTGYAFGTAINSGNVLTPNVHYSIDTTTLPPVITSLDATNCPDGVYELSVNYVPSASRNDPPQGISNRVDVYCDGSRPTDATEIAILDARVTVSATPGGDYSYNRFLRDDGTWPDNGNLLMRLSLAPIVDVPDTLSVGNTTLTLGTDYWAIHESGLGSGAWNAFDGIEVLETSIQSGAVSITSSTNASPIVVTIGSHTYTTGQTVLIEGHTTNTAANGYWTIQAVGATTITLQGSTGNGVGGATGTVTLVSPVSVNYTYNNVPRAVQSNIETWRMLTTDVLVHEGTAIPLKIDAAVILKPGVSVSSISSAMNNSVSVFLGTLGFGASLQVSDLLNVMGDVLGVDAVRLLNSTDMTSISITGATNAAPIVLTVGAGHGVEAGDIIVVDGVGGNTAANGKWIVSSTGSTSITLLNSVGNGSYTSGGTLVLGDFAITRMERDGTTRRTLYASSTSPFRAADIQAADNEYFTLNSINLTVKAANSWGGY